ncbi:hypothetical protein PAT3040_02654 [Paenibacillus agaridevorans]|jgi:predicted ArsR family transcriptional regulator|uniref:Uncharacterized protein n=1 Tax=Paenibacillus agaridevorans TaxID=171404 RepID=A0A2R5ENF1_9BACL|nr:hypothetical protein [Paenibacillus agaridevorans]GBG08087.1 hypothetical protein PAT3040_02654 [Paenibacillus agaridevorans]
MDNRVNEVLKQVENLLQGLQPEERQRVLAQLLQRQGYAPGAFAVGKNYDFWFTGEDDVYDRL